jgi:23S rRNA pseudouridine2605 synthase/16S rRNA pseudouridine516 synthase
VVVLAFHKAVGLVTTHHDEHGRETVYQRLRAVLPRPLRDVAWHAIGRLDKDTSGLLLFTDDGALVHHATQPSTGLPKTYRVLAKGLLGEAELSQLRAGVELSGGLGRSALAEARVVAHQIATSWLELTLREGKNREVRRMLLAVGSQVIRLERVRIGALTLDLPVDGWRVLTEAEVVEGLGYRGGVSVAPRVGRVMGGRGRAAGAGGRAASPGRARGRSRP